MPRPVVNKSKCTNCLDCVEVCPVNIFSNSNGKLEVNESEECIGCRSCEAQCEQQAIKVKD